ncbi:hypothetical protein BJV82DRAFT_623991 [Fennellomyces sp. T-0311]|nr:hypothetical protein BJV82DRAFT_623991 [Fennellomyces sp. T-0311]
MTNSNNPAEIGKKQLLKQYGIFCLPADILLSVFKHFDRSDCLNSMAVCRIWYDNVPQYSQHLWKHLKMRRLDYYENNKRWQHCIGGHVKVVTFDKSSEDETLAMMQILIDCNCHEIEFLEFRSCNVFATKKELFLERLRQLGIQLTELKFNNHRTNLHFMHLLHICPRLVDLIYIPTQMAYNDGLYDVEPDVLEPELPKHLEFSSLTYLCIDGYIDKRRRLEPILQKCPNLRYLVYSSGERGTYQGSVIVPSYQTTMMDLDVLFSWCPKLLYLQANCDVFSGYREDFMEWSDTKYQSVTELGLRYLNTAETEGYGTEQIAPHIQRNASTLYSLVLTGPQQTTLQEPQNWSVILGTIYMPQLRKLQLRGALIESNALIAMLSRCLNLEQLFVMIGGLSLNLSQALQNLGQLKQLQLAYLKLEFDGIHEDPAARFFNDLAARGSKLEMISLYEIPHIMTDELLAAMARLPKLKVLKVELDQDRCTDDGFCRFVDMLDGTAVENLEFSNMQYIPRETFDSIGNLTRLKTLRLISPRGFGIPVYADGNGLMRLLRKTNVDELYFDSVRLFSPPDSVMNMLKREPLRYELTSLDDYAADFIQNEYYVKIERVRD